MKVEIESLERGYIVSVKTDSYDNKQAIVEAFSRYMGEIQRSSAEQQEYDIDPDMFRIKYDKEKPDGFDMSGLAEMMAGVGGERKLFFATWKEVVQFTDTLIIEVDTSAMTGTPQPNVKVA